jgi:hypothetical protein
MFQKGVGGAAAKEVRRMSGNRLLAIEMIRLLGSLTKIV